MLESTLSRIVHSVEGALGAVVLGTNGLVIEAVDADGKRTSPDQVANDYASVFKQILSVSETMELGEVLELTVDGADRSVLARMLTPNYFVALMVDPTTIPGKARFLLRITAPDLTNQLC